MMKRYGLWKLKQKVPILGSQDNGAEMEVVVFVVKLLKHCKACILLLNSLSIVRHVFYFMLFYSILFLFLFFIFFLTIMRIWAPYIYLPAFPTKTILQKQKMKASYKYLESGKLGVSRKF